MNREIVIGIDLGSSAVKTVAAEKKKSDTLPFILGAGICPSHGLRKGIIVDVKDAAASIKESLKQSLENLNSIPKQALVSVSGAGLDGIRAKGSISVSRADHEISENDLKRAIGQSETQLRRNFSSYLLNREIIHTFPITYKIDEELVIGNPLGMRGEKLEVETLFITVLSQHLANLIKSMEMAGVTVEDVVADSVAVSHALLNKKEKEVGCLIVNIGGDVSSIITYEEGVPISMEVFPIGSNHISYDIAQGMQILLEEAEAMKISYGGDSLVKKKLSGIIVPRLNDIFDWVENHLVKIKRSQLLPAGIILTGGGANLHGIDEVARASLKLPVQLSRHSFSGNSKNIINNPTWSVALGLCYLGLNGEINSVNDGMGAKAKNLLIRCLKNLLP